MYVSVDVEASGLTPGKYSMLSLGACIVGNTDIQFYRELKPISDGFSLDAMKIGCRGLKCLEGLMSHQGFNPRSPHFNPKAVLKVMNARGESPEKVMAEFADWIHTYTKGYKPIEVASPIKFDGMYTAWYFDNFYPHKNPLGYGGEDMNSMYRGLMKDIYAHTKPLRTEKANTPHNALEDAIEQAKGFEKVLELMRKK